MMRHVMTNAPAEQPTQSWEDAVSVARKHVETLIARLPEDLRREASALECEFRKRCDDPDAQDTMGSYSRSAQRIRLYLHAIDEHCRAEGGDYAREIETTFLHELGHHLGLEEDDLEKRGL
jgi:hypothetical protein